jgi:DNA-directed RNA polymerase specialized sigma subunit
LQIINEYNTKEPFYEYFLSSLWNWKPKLKTEDRMQHSSLFKINDKGEEEILDIEDKRSQEHVSTNLNIEDIFAECKTENEKKICQLYLTNPNITEEELGKKLKMTKQNISLILKRLRKRLKYYLTN